MRSKRRSKLSPPRPTAKRSSVALLYIGLDNFRAVNEAYGLRVGDGLLAVVGQRLAALADDRPGSGGGAPGVQVARAVGDEFMLLLRADRAHAAEAAARVLQALAQPFAVEALTLQMSASVGVALYPDDGARQRLVAHAALAMRSVKQGGGNGHALFTPAMDVDSRDQSSLLLDLRQAVARHELQLVYQPKIDAKTRQITAAEALLRWQHPKRGLISPAQFIALAERHGLMAGIGSWVIEEACRQAARWRDAGLRMRVAVNLSGHQLRRDDLVEQIEASLARHQMPPQRLICEVTESVALEDSSVTRAALERLRRAGLPLSIDNFGSGHSSLAALRRLPAAELKIDRSFVADLVGNAQAHSIVRAVVQMAHSLQMRVVGEGVETDAQRDALVQLGCDELQGYLFAKPISAQALALWAEGDGPLADSAFRPSLFEPTAPAPLDL